MSKNVIEVNEQNFQSEILEAEGLALLDFAADWCGPCRMMAPILEELATEKQGLIKVGKLDVDQNPNLASQFNIRSIPALIFFKDGKAVEGIVGAVPKGILDRKIAELA